MVRNDIVKLFGKKEKITDPRIQKGLALARDKRAITDNASDSQYPTVRTLKVPNEIVVPLIDYHRRTLHTRLKVGDKIRCGDAIAESLVAPASGIVSHIEPREIAHHTTQRVNSVVIEVDHQRDAIESTQPLLPAVQHLTLSRLQQMGVAGFGGAGFPTDKKLSARQDVAVHTLIINAAECEPVIACDEALMQVAEYAEDTIRGIELLIKFTKCQRCVLVIENDKALALNVMQQAIDALHESSSDACQISLMPIEPIYPSGAERPLVELVAKQRLDPQCKPSDIGIICVNVATALSLAKAADGLPTISRIITVAGNRAHESDNVRVRIGTSIQEVLRQTDNLQASSGNRVRIGGPLSGFDLINRNVPVTIKTNCITIDAPSPDVNALPCIRCGHCEDVCPVHLAPQQLYWFGQTDRQDYLDRYQLDNCIECACCDLVCPSQIPLTDTFRQLRASRQTTRNEAARAYIAEERYQAHINRTTSRARAKEQQLSEAQNKIKTAASSSEDVLARIKRKRGTNASASNGDRGTKT